MDRQISNAWALVVEIQSYKKCEFIKEFAWDFI